MSKFKGVLPIVGVVIGVLICFGLIFFIYNQYTNNKVAGAEVEEIVKEVSKLIQLPTDEVPQLVTVSDVTKLSDKPFFKNAKNGDKLLIYEKNNKAILYDPKAKKIIEVAPVVTEQTTIYGTSGKTQESSGSAKASPSPSIKPATVDLKAKVALFNGAGRRGLASKKESELKAKYPGVTTSTGNTEKNDYEKTVVVIVQSASKSDATKVAEFFKTTVGTLPAGEKAPEGVDILVILGKDQS